ncbi:MAG: alpha/beta hydrolase [Candidatus Limnocylindria bacterium]
MIAHVTRREFDKDHELVTPPVRVDAYRHESHGAYVRLDGIEYLYDSYMPANPSGSPPPVVVFVHGDAPPEFLRGARLWGQYRSWAALAAASGLAAITFDHASSEGRTRMPDVVEQIGQLLDIVHREADELGLDPRRIAVWSGSAGVPFGFIASLDRPEIRCQVLFYGPMDLRIDASRNPPGVASDLLAEYSPMTHVERRGGAIPPTLIAKAALDRDGINDSIDAFVARSIALGAAVELEVHEDGRHAFDVMDEGERSRQIIGRALDYMRGQLQT